MLSVNNPYSPYSHDTLSLALERYHNICIIGYAMISFVVLSYLMLIPSYFRVEKTRKQRLKALPFLLISSWPQYRGLRLLNWAYFDQQLDKLTLEKEIFDQDLSHLGKLSSFE